MAWSKFVSPHLPLNLFHNGMCCNPTAFPFTTDRALILQTWPPQWPVAQQGHLRTLGRRLSLHPYLWHGIRLSVVSTPHSLFHFPSPLYMMGCSDFFLSLSLHRDKVVNVGYHGALFFIVQKHQCRGWAFPLRISLSVWYCCDLGSRNLEAVGVSGVTHWENEPQLLAAAVLNSFCKNNQQKSFLFFFLSYMEYCSVALMILTFSPR